jgi:hypothetical protein
MANRPTVAALPDMADIPRQSLQDPGFRRLLYGADDPVPGPVCVPGGSRSGQPATSYFTPSTSRRSAVRACDRPRFLSRNPLAIAIATLALAVTHESTTDPDALLARKGARPLRRYLK